LVKVNINTKNIETLVALIVGLELKVVFNSLAFTASTTSSKSDALLEFLSISEELILILRDSLKNSFSLSLNFEILFDSVVWVKFSVDEPSNDTFLRSIFRDLSSPKESFVSHDWVVEVVVGESDSSEMIEEFDFL
jgi:hypothetical protein